LCACTRKLGASPYTECPPPWLLTSWRGLTKLFETGNLQNPIALVAISSEIAFQRFFLARVNAALRADSRRLRVAAALRPAARRFRVNAPCWAGVSLALGFALRFAFMVFLLSEVTARSRIMARCGIPYSLSRAQGLQRKVGTIHDELNNARSTDVMERHARSERITNSLA